MTDDRGQTHFFGDGHDHGDPPPDLTMVAGDQWERNPRHALYIGAVWGIGMRYGIPLHPVVDENGDYTDQLEWRVHPDITIRFVIPEPPEDWHIKTWMDATDEAAGVE